jgi:GR25 family glycosyltransferase involved in LPS biosynthesis
MKIQDFFQKGYYINLDRRPDRNEVFKSEMGRVGLGDFFERVSAEDGILEPDHLKKHHYCAYTHYKLFQKIYDEGHEYVLVFEDDAFFYDGWDKFGIELVENALDEIQNFPDWDMIYLGGCPISKIKKVSNTLCSANLILNAHAIGFKRSTIKFVLDHYTPFQDSFIDSWYGAYKDIKKYIINPIAVPQGPMSSDLDTFGHSATMNTYFNCYKTAFDKID